MWKMLRHYASGQVKKEQIYRTTANWNIQVRRDHPVKCHPDFVFPKGKIAVFVDGCFWRGYNCRSTRPARGDMDIAFNYKKEMPSYKIVKTV